METKNEVQNPPQIKHKPSIPWRTRISLSLVSAVTDASRRQNGTVNRRLLKIFNITAPPNGNPVNGVKSSDVTLDPTRNLWFRVFIPTGDEARNSASLPIIVFFHGGGFVYLSADTKEYDAVCRRFARKVPAVVVSVNYRLAPEHRYPAQYDDGFDVLRFLDDEKNDGILPENADVSHCFLAGDSAGGNLAHHVAKRAAESSFRRLKVGGVVAIQPFFGGEERTEAEEKLAKFDHLISVARTDWMWKSFLPGPGEDRDHQVINVSGPRAADISKLDFPPTIVLVAAFDPLKDWQKKYYHWLKTSGKEAYLVEYPNVAHAFYIFPEVPESKQLIQDVKGFIRTHS
nr:probable carboxylesterase 18 [Ipomoea batatas]